MMQPGTQLGDHDLAIALFEGHPIRHTWHQGQWYYSVVDVIAAITQSGRASRYWFDTKRRLQEEGVQLSDLIGQLPLPASDNRFYQTDCASAEGILRIIQSVRSPRAEPFRQWLAEVGAQTLMEQEEATSQRVTIRRHLFRVKAGLRALVAQRGITTDRQMAAFDDAGYEGRTLLDLQVERRIWLGQPLEDYMGDVELAANLFQEANTAALIEREGIEGPEALGTAHYDMGVETRLALQRMGTPMPETQPRLSRLRPQEYLPPPEEREEA